MKGKILNRIAFIGKSMLWALCLYMILMLVFNWDDIKKTAAGTNAVVVITPDQSQTQGIFNKPSSVPSSISQHTSALKGVIVLVKTICGIGAGIGK